MTPDNRVDPYLAGWAATTRLMHEGKSWSGHERNCCYLNQGDRAVPRFVNVSAVTGLDVDDDGRALALSDWDGDGDVDLWFKNRTGPQLRYFRNNIRNEIRGDGSTMPHFVAVRLRGTRCNRDAIGATVRVVLPDRTLVKELRAGEGYLAQSSKWLHFGLGRNDRIDRLEIRWPNGAIQQLESVDVDRRYIVVEEQENAAAVPRRHLKLMTQHATPDKQPSRSRIVLKEPIPLPPSVLAELQQAGRADRPRLLLLWASWCEPCMAELATLTGQALAFDLAGVGLQPVNLDDELQRPSAMARFDEIVRPGRPRAGAQGALEIAGDVGDERGKGDFRVDSAWGSDRLRTVVAAVMEHVLHGVDGQVPLPTSMLVDAQGRVQIIYLGVVDGGQVLADGRTYGQNAVQGSKRSSFGGRWFYRTYRDWAGLADTLSHRGLSDESAFYRKKSVPRP